jgi:ribosomal protein L16 Arg81 hydroxylase
VPVAGSLLRLSGPHQAVSDAKGAQGFDAHFDTHEVFVLQIEGTKHWRIYGLAREAPLVEEQAEFAREQLGPPTREVLLQAGDLLYLPRGYVHEAFTSETLSLHLTVGVKVFRWVDLLHQAVDELSTREVRFRRSLPRGLLTGGTSLALSGQLRELLQVLAEGARADEAVVRLAAGFVEKLRALPGNYFAEVDVERINLDTVVQRTPGALCHPALLPDGRTSLRFPGELGLSMEPGSRPGVGR